MKYDAGMGSDIRKLVASLSGHAADTAVGAIKSKLSYFGGPGAEIDRRTLSAIHRKVEDVVDRELSDAWAGL
jgi:hypothetical protein